MQLQKMEQDEVDACRVYKVVPELSLDADSPFEMPMIKTKTCGEGKKRRRKEFQIRKWDCKITQ
jgi:hypothetical protein